MKLMIDTSICRQLVSKVLIAVALVTLTTFGLYAMETAHETVQKATDQLIAKLLEVKPLYEENPDQFYMEVEEALNPYIDFKRFSQGVMSKYYRSMPEDQRVRFATVLKSDLIHTYAKALVEFDNEKIVVLPAGDAVSSRPNESVVQIEVHSKDGTVYKVQYRMSSKTGSWKLINVVVDGINLGLIFRNQFLSLMDDHRGAFDKVIQNWNSRVGESDSE
jgi:phospholipid transport system substrate-binding protein